MAKRNRSSASGPRTRSKAAKERREAEEVANARRLDKLPPELWEKILDHLESDDLFPLALSCRYFREKQKELVARKRPVRGKPRLALKTNLKRNRRNGEPMSDEYLRFCSKETVSKKRVWERDYCIIHLAAFHGYLPLLQELLDGSDSLDPEITRSAGESSSSQSLLFLGFGF